MILSFYQSSFIICLNQDIKRVGIQGDSSKSNEESVRLEEPSSSIADGEQADKSTSAKQIPLGLGGGLQPKVNRSFLFICKDFIIPLSANQLFAVCIFQCLM